MTQVAQPNASRLPRQLLEGIVESVVPEPRPVVDEIVFRDQHSNDFAELRFNDGRSLVVKVARYEWAVPRFQSSRLASHLIRQTTGLLAPIQLSAPHLVGDRPVEAYWRIDLPTLQDLWPGLEHRQRKEVMESWGHLLAQLHAVEFEGFGVLNAERTTAQDLSAFLRSELEQRLRPAVKSLWPEALPALERLVGGIPEVVRRVGSRSCLVHGDMHMGNVLCEIRGDRVGCVGLLDLETSLAAPAESDAAVLQLHHGPLFNQPIEGPWLQHVLAGYGDELDEFGLAFFRAFHLLNMGFYSAMLGHDWHAAQVARAAVEQAAGLDRFASPGSNPAQQPGPRGLARKVG